MDRLRRAASVKLLIASEEFPDRSSMSPRLAHSSAVFRAHFDSLPIILSGRREIALCLSLARGRQDRFKILRFVGLRGPYRHA